MNLQSFLVFGGTFILGATASMWAPSSAWFGYTVIALLICLPLVLLVPLHSRLVLICITFLMGASLVLFTESQTLKQHIQLPPDHRLVDVYGEVSNHPEINDWRSRFEFQVVDSDRPEVIAGHKLLISCYECPHNFQRGDMWRLAVKLKPPHGYASPGAYDYEKWLLRHEIHATGYVKDVSSNGLILANKPGIVGIARMQLKQWFDSQVIVDSDGRAVAQALILGDRTGFDDRLWSTFRRTGVAHIFAISGLHVGMVWLFVSIAVRWFSRFWPRLYLYLPAQFIAGWSGVGAAVFYAALSGWGVPVQRAILMLVLFQLNQSFGRQRCPLHGLLLIAVVMVLIDPLVVLDISYWMSCYAVFALILLTRNEVDAGDHDHRTGCSRLMGLQIKLNLLMAPLVLLIFGEVSLIAPLVNIILVPLLGSVFLPGLILIACCYLAGAKVFATALLSEVCFVLDWMVSGLQVIAAYEFSAIQVSYAAGICLALLVAVFTFWRLRADAGWLITLQTLGKALMLTILATGLIYLSGGRFGDLKHGEFEVHVLDVGQGLSVVVRSANRILLYDVGSQFRNGSTVADSVILPWLQHYGIHKLDFLIISHGDNDHIGGLNRVLAMLDVDRIHTSVESLLTANEGVSVDDCNEIAGFSFDGIEAEYLNGGGDYLTTNNRSCVLKLSGVGGSLLLSGDIEKQAEGSLVEYYQNRLRSDVLVVPHHGSKTSSRPIFLEAVQPTEAAISSGFLNSYRHPASTIVQRYQSRDIRLRNTATSGTLSYYFRTDGLQSSKFRSSSPRLWRRVKDPLDRKLSRPGF